MIVSSVWLSVVVVRCGGDVTGVGVAGGVAVPASVGVTTPPRILLTPPDPADPPLTVLQR
jgi:hypothetical protein